MSSSKTRPIQEAEYAWDPTPPKPIPQSDGDARPLQSELDAVQARYPDGPSALADAFDDQYAGEDEFAGDDDRVESEREPCRWCGNESVEPQSFYCSAACAQFARADAQDDEQC